jgi:hypothetical protein
VDVFKRRVCRLLKLSVVRTVFHEQIGWQVIEGTFAAISGVSVLFFV